MITSVVVSWLLALPFALVEGSAIIEEMAKTFHYHDFTGTRNVFLDGRYWSKCCDGSYNSETFEDRNEKTFPKPVAEVKMAEQNGQGLILYTDGSVAQIFTPTDYIKLPAGRKVVEISPAGDSSCFLLDDATVRCIGLGYRFGSEGATPPGDGLGDNMHIVNLGAGRKAVSLGKDVYQGFCAGFEDGDWKCWGDKAGMNIPGLNANSGNRANTMGDNLGTVDLGGRTVVSFHSSYPVACFIDSNGDAACAAPSGNAGNGRQGVGPVGSSTHKDQRRANAANGFANVDFGSRKVKSFVLTRYKSWALLDDGTVLPFGHSTQWTGTAVCGVDVIGDDCKSLPLSLFDNKKILAVDGGVDCLGFLTEDGSVWEQCKTNAPRKMDAPLPRTETTTTLTTKTSTTPTTTSTQLVWVSGCTGQQGPIFGGLLVLILSALV